jgi:uncharacterized C2H2 Zn-finger protein
MPKTGELREDTVVHLKDNGKGLMANSNSLFTHMGEITIPEDTKVTLRQIIKCPNCGSKEEKERINPRGGPGMLKCPDCGTLFDKEDGTAGDKVMEFEGFPFKGIKQGHGSEYCIKINGEVRPVEFPDGTEDGLPFPWLLFEL